MSLRVDLLKLADAVIGWPLCRLVGLLPAPAAAPAAPPRRVLVIRPGGIGDAVLFVPLLREITAAWPGVELDVLAERRNAAVVDGSRLARRVLRYDVPRDLLDALRRPYDLVIDTEQSHYLSAVIAWLTRAPRRVGFATNARARLFSEPVPYDPSAYEVRTFLHLARQATGRAPGWDPDARFYPLAPDVEARGAERLAPLSGRPVVAIHPGASIPERRWPVPRYVELARRLVDDGCAILLVGGAPDRDAAAQIAAALDPAHVLDLSGRIGLEEIAGVLARADVYVSADTGPLHIAYSVGTPTVHLFGAGVLEKWGPPGSRFRSIRADVPCSPCTRFGYTPPCNQGLACMQKIEVDRVLEAVRERLSSADG